MSLFEAKYNTTTWPDNFDSAAHGAINEDDQ